MTSFTANWLPDSTSCPRGPILELLQLIDPPVYVGEDVSGQDVSSLDRCLCGRRDEFPVPIGNRRAIAYSPHTWVILHPQVTVNDHPIAFGHGEIEIPQLDIWTISSGLDNISAIISRPSFSTTRSALTSLA